MAQYSGLFLNFPYGVVGKNRKTVFGGLEPASTNRRFLEIDPHLPFSVIGAKSGSAEILKVRPKCIVDYLPCRRKKIAFLNKSNAKSFPETLYGFTEYWTVNEFVKQLLEGNVISSIEDEKADNFDKKVSEWIANSYEEDFNLHESERLQKLTKEIFDQIVYLRLTGKLTGILSLHKFGKS